MNVSQSNNLSVSKLGLLAKQKPQFRYNGIAVFVFLWYNEAKKHKEESYGKGSI